MAEENSPTMNASDPSQQGGEQASGETDFESLVSEFQTPQPKTVETPDVGKLLDGMKPIVQYVENDMQNKAAASEKDAVDSAVGFLKGADGLAEIDDSLVKGFLQNQYSDNKSFRDAYDNRSQDKTSWDTALEGARDLMTEKVGSLPQKVKTDIEAAEATVRGTSQSEVSEADDDVIKMFAMSDVEFNNYKLSKDSGA